ncbi:hypothetical protein AMTRI_Chr11g150400 [Amborella trichopoda]
MAPKPKKSPKTPSFSSTKRSTPDQKTSIIGVNQSPETPLLSYDDESFDLALMEASFRFPGFIYRNSFQGRVTEVEAKMNGPFTTIWLSEAAMAASSLLPGSYVSVSLASSKGSPLESLAITYSEKFSINMADSIGAFFAVAVVWPSRKVLKNDVRLSWNLSCTMGNPSLGRIVFVSTLECYSISPHLKSAQNPVDDKLQWASLRKCKDIYLKLLPLKENRTQNSFSTPTKTGSDGSDPSKNEKLDYTEVRLALEDEKICELLKNYAARWLCGRSLFHGNVVMLPICGHDSAFQVVAGKSFHDSEKNSDAPFLINTKTEVHLLSSTRSNLESDKIGARPLIGFEIPGNNKDSGSEVSKLGGLSEEAGFLDEIIYFSLINRDTLARLGVQPTKGVLLHGPPGTGKTSLACACVHDAGVNLFSINGPEIVSQYYGESEQALHEVFKSATEASPSVVFIDELDAIAPARKDGSEELSQRMVAALLNLMDGTSRNDGILVIAATNRPDSIDPALRRPGRFDREIEIGVPSPGQRFEILQKILRGMSHSLIDTEIQYLASSTHGFVGADLTALCNEAALISLRRYIECGNSIESPMNFEDDSIESVSSLLLDLSISSEHVHLCGERNDLSETDTAKNMNLTNTCGGKNISSCGGRTDSLLRVTPEDFEKAKTKVRPSAMREVMLEVPKVGWKDIGGQHEVKQQLREAVEWPQKHQDAFKRIGTNPPRGILMFGPPGCSKTLMARAVASEAGLNFLAVKGPELFSKWVGESEKAVRSLFAKARGSAPSIIFFDEIDGLAVARGNDGRGASVGDRVISQLLVELDGLNQRVGVTVIAATNRPDKIDQALLRPGRFDRLLYVGPPNHRDREDIFRIHVNKIPCGSDVNLSELASLTEGCTGADVSLICREAALAALEESLDMMEVSMRHFNLAIGRVQPSGVRNYQELSIKFQRLVSSSS